MTTVVFIPGLLSDSRVWKPVADSLDVPKVFADITRHNTIPEMAQQLLTEYPDNLILVAHSMGARVAIEMARQAKHRVMAMILSNTGHAPVRQGEKGKRQALVDLGYRDLHALAGQWLLPMLAAERHSDEALIEYLTDMVFQTGAQAHERQINALLTRPDAAVTLKAIKCPVLFLAGTQDTWSPVAQHEEMMGMTPNASLEIVRGAGHFLPIEMPNETSVIVQTWLSSLGVKSNVSHHDLPTP